MNYKNIWKKIIARSSTKSWQIAKETIIRKGLATRQSLHQWKKGLTRPNPECQAELVELLNVNPEFVITGKGQIFK